MEKIDNKETNKNTKGRKKALNSNPIKKVKSPIDGIQMISVPQNDEIPPAKTNATIPQDLTQKRKSLDKLITPISIVEDATLDSIVETINNFNTTKSKPKSYAQNFVDSSSYSNPNVNYFDVLKNLSDIFQNSKNMINLVTQLNDIFVNKLKWNFVAFGMLHEKSKCINLKLYSKTGNTYSSKVFLSDETNPIIECFNTKSIISKDNINYLNIPYLAKTSSVIVPMISVNKCIGIMLVGKSITSLNMALTTFFSNYMGMFIHNAQLLEQTNKYANTDTLTSLYNHRGFQEILAKEITKAKETETPLSVVMFDVNNISKINRELGHAKGDEVIKTIAEKIKQNIRANDSAGRYGGDEIAIIMPNTNTKDAKYLAEYITYCLSCCFVDDVGPIKVSVGVSTYPECTIDQEKLLILAEQAMFISQAKGYKEGMSAIISSSDFNFWDDVALDSFAEVLAKRHSQIGINFEEELVHKFNQEEIINHNHLMEMVTSIAGAIDAKDPYTKGHSTSVSRYAEALARAVNLPETEVERIKIGALLHDVGKIGIPESVLKKPGKLTDEEWEIMKQHPTIGAEKVLAPNEALRDLIPIVKYHHERLDGKGYPEQLKGDEIPLAARIVSVADAYHALVSDRPYRKGMPIEKACAILKEGAGIQWDSHLVRQFISIAPSLTTNV
ncbi:MAG: diguanylate cyclase [Cyanobacteria bacterium SIG26]|nr:diguanylate cyclase [Cyanobacteria bacterium SIG26]